jgi:hypothetical protein
VVGLPNKRLVKAALAAFFEEQHLDGTWVSCYVVLMLYKTIGLLILGVFLC